MGRLDNTTALITGASAGIGRACALAFAREGARIAALARRQDPLEALCSEIAKQGGEVLALPADVTRADEIDRAVTAAVDRFGPFHILVNSAGIPFIGTAESTSETDWNRVLSVNTTGTFLVSRAAIPVLRQAVGGPTANPGSV